IAFRISSDGEAVRVAIGSWSWTGEGVAQEAVQERGEIVKTILRGLYPDLGFEREPAEEASEWALSGLGLGMPQGSTPDPVDGALAMDRLLRAMSGGAWSTLILAQPVSESVTSEVRAEVINENRTIQAASEAMRAPSPLAEHYAELLKKAA